MKTNKISPEARSLAAQILSLSVLDEDEIEKLAQQAINAATDPDPTKPRIVLTLEGDTVQQLWSNLNWLLCNAVESKQSNSNNEWPLMVSETYRGKIEAFEPSATKRCSA